MALEKKKRALLIKFFYKNDSYFATALREYQCFKNFRKGTMPRQALKNK